MKFFTLLALLTISPSIYARSYVIFSMSQDLPMGVENEVIRKNYYLNIGAGQGVKKDSVLDVFRVMSIQNPYDNRQRVNYKVKIGELKVLHSSDEASIAMLNKLEENSPVFEIPHFMIGDHVAINVN
jgi:hypothetical protein